MPDEKKKVSCWIPLKTLADLEDKGYHNKTEAILAGLECLITGDTTEDNGRLDEAQKHIETLKIELDRANQDKQILSDMYNSHVLQVQTLINQKAIEAPGAKKPWWKIW